MIAELFKLQCHHLHLFHQHLVEPTIWATIFPEYLQNHPAEKAIKLPAEMEIP